MRITVDIDTSLPITEADKVVLLALAGQITLGDEPQIPSSASVTAAVEPADVPDDVQQAKAEEATPKAAEPVTEEPKTERKRRSRCSICGDLHFGGTGGHEEAAPQAAEPVTEAAPTLAAVPEPVEEPEQADEPAEEPTPEPEAVTSAPVTVDVTALREQVVKTATELVAAGKAPEVRKVLNEIGVRRVSEIEDADLQRFLDAVAAA